jgi:hypothetical protein
MTANQLAHKPELRSIQAAVLLGRGALAIERGDPLEAQPLLATALELSEQNGFRCYRDQADRSLALTHRAPREA